MFKKFKPTWMLEAIYELTPEQLQNHGVKAILTDLDNTLIAWNNPDGTIELLEWIEQMKIAGIPVVVVSNNKAERINRAVHHLGLNFVARALKPFGKGIREAQKKLALEKKDLIMVGDQLMTDIRGGNGVGVRTVLVKPIVTTDAWNTKLNRMMERVVMKHLRKKNPDMKWEKTLK